MVSEIRKYKEEIIELIESLDEDSLQKIIQVLSQARKQKKNIFIIGNGGSAATATHFTADLGKNTIKDNHNRFKVISLVENMSYITAYSNDQGYENVFAEQLKNLIAPSDLLVAISASGNSENVIKAAEVVKENQGTVIGLTGFDGGKLKKISDLCIHIDSEEYEQVEDLHMIITHIIVYMFKSV